VSHLAPGASDKDKASEAIANVIVLNLNFGIPMVSSTPKLHVNECVTNTPKKSLWLDIFSWLRSALAEIG